MKTILYIDHSESWKFPLQEELSEERYQGVTTGDIQEALSELNGINPDVIILELRQKRFIREKFENVKKKYPNIPWIGFFTFFQCPNEYKKMEESLYPKIDSDKWDKEFDKGALNSRTRRFK